MLFTTSPWSCSGIYRCYYAGCYCAATTYFEGNRNPFESWPLVVVVVILVVINLSYKESLWLPLRKTYVTNEITSNFDILTICQKE